MPFINPEIPVQFREAWNIQWNCGCAVLNLSSVFYNGRLDISSCACDVDLRYEDAKPSHLSNEEIGDNSVWEDTVAVNEKTSVFVKDNSRELNLLSTKGCVS